MDSASEDSDTLFVSPGKADKVGLTTGKEKHVKDSYPSDQSRWVSLANAALLLFTFAILGVNMGLLGPTLLDLQDRVNTNTYKVSATFSVRAVGWLSGYAVSSPVFSRINNSLLMSFCLFVTVVANIAIAKSTNPSNLLLSIGFHGFALGCLSKGGKAKCVSTGGRKMTSLMVALYCTFAIGAGIAPLIAKPFIEIQSSNETTTMKTQIPSTPTTLTPALNSVTSTSNITSTSTSNTTNTITSSTTPSNTSTSSTTNTKTSSTTPLNTTISSTTLSSTLTSSTTPSSNSTSSTTLSSSMTSISTIGNTGSKRKKRDADDGGGKDNIASGTSTGTSNTTTATTTIPHTTTSITTTSNTTTSITTTSITITSNTTKSNSTTPHATTYSTVTQHTSAHLSESKVQTAYHITAALTAVLALFFLGSFILGSNSPNQQTEEVRKSHYSSHNNTVSSQLKFLGILFTFYLLSNGVQVAYSGLIMVYIVAQTDHTLEPAEGPSVLCLFWVGCSVTRGLVWLGRDILSPAISVKVLLSGLILAFISVVGILMVPNGTVVWMCSLTLGGAMGPLLPVSLSWIEEYFGITGINNIIIILGLACGEIILPVMAGYLMETYDPNSFIYCILFSIMLNAIICFILMKLTSSGDEPYTKPSVILKQKGSGISEDKTGSSVLPKIKSFVKVKFVKETTQSSTHKRKSK